MFVNSGGDSVLEPGNYRIFVSNAAPVSSAVKKGAAKPVEATIRIVL